MSGAFAEVTRVVSAAEQAWNDVAGKLDSAAAELSAVELLGDQDLALEVTQVQAELDRLRGLLNADPLGGQANPAAADRLLDRARAVAARSADLARLRDGAKQRIATVTAAADAARAAREDAAEACLRAAAKITAVPPVPADRTDLYARIAALDPLLAAGRWTRLSSELDLIERELASATSSFRDTERTVAALLSRRDELRGLLDAYKVKAARLGAAEDQALDARYDQARELLWTAPCDLNASADAVNRFQQAVLAIGAQRL
jgi:chromosome segregation ATPase